MTLPHEPVSGNPHARRYPARAAVRARELRDAGWSLRHITLLIRRELGLPVAQSTVCGWVDEEQARKQRLRSYNAHRRRWNAKVTGRLGSPHLTLDFKLIRLRALHEHGLSASSIARVMSFDFPDQPLTEHQVRYSLRTGSVPRSWRTAA